MAKAQRNELIDLGTRGMPLTVVGTNIVAGKAEMRTVNVWLSKLNDFEHKKAIDRADAARSRVLAVRHAPNDDEYAAIRMDVEMLSEDELIDIIVAEETEQIKLRIEAQAEDEEPWNEDNYLSGLRDAWIGPAGAGGLALRYLEDSEDVEAKRVFSELQRFRAMVDERIAIEVENLRHGYREQPRPEIVDEALNGFIDDLAKEAWYSEFLDSQVWLGTRRCAHKVADGDDHESYHPDRYFAERHQVNEMQTEVKDQLRGGFGTLLSNPVEGKDSPASPASSPESDSSVEPETVEVSGPAAPPA